jgi:hypothetical protein
VTKAVITTPLNAELRERLLATETRQTKFLRVLPAGAQGERAEADGQGENRAKQQPANQIKIADASLPRKTRTEVEQKGDLAAMPTVAQETKRSPETGDLIVPVQWLRGRDLPSRGDPN